MSGSMFLSEALNVLQGRGLAREAAEARMVEKLRLGDLPSRAEWRQHVPRWRVSPHAARESELLQPSAPGKILEGIEPFYWAELRIAWDDSEAFLPDASGGGTLFRGIHVPRGSLDNLFPPAEIDSIPSISDKSKFKDRRGARSDVRWEAVLIEAARHMYSRQEAGKLEDLISHTLTWLADPAGGPAPATMKEHLSPLWRAFKDSDGG